MLRGIMTCVFVLSVASLAGAQGQRRGLLVEGVHHVGAVRPGQTVVQREKRTFADQGGGGVQAILPRENSRDFRGCP